MATVEHGPRLDSLRHDFESARGASVEQSIQRLLEYGAHDHTDWKSMLQVVEIGYESLFRNSERSQRGKQLLEKLNDYLAVNGVTHKFIIPETTEIRSSSSQGQEVGGLIRKIQQYETRIATQRKPDFGIPRPAVTMLSEMVRTLHVSLSLDSSDIHNKIIPVVTPNHAPIDMSRLEVALDQRPQKYPLRDLASKRYWTVFSDLIKLSSSEPEVAAAARDELFTLFAQSVPEKTSGMPDITTKQWGGVSLREIMDTTTEDVDTLGKKILTYLGSTPKGDVFWGKLATIFVIPALEVYDIRPGTAQTEFTRKRFIFQSWIADKLFLPIFNQTDEKPDDFPEEFADLVAHDGAFDALFSQFISNLRPELAKFFGGYSLHQLCIRPTQTIRYIYPDVRENELLEHSNILLFEEILRAQGRDVAMTIPSRILNAFFITRWESIESELAARLYTNLGKKRYLFDSMLGAFRSQLDPDYDTSHADSVSAFFEQNIGGNFMEWLQSGGREQLHETSDSIWEDIAHAEFWPASATPHPLEFSKGSLASIIGINSLTLVVGEDNQQPIGIHFKLNDGKLGVTGKTDSEGNVEWFFDEGRMDEGLLEVLRFIGLASLRDSVKYRDEVIRERRLLHKAGEVKVEHTDEKKKRKRRTATLPHTRVIYTNPQADIHMPNTSDELISEIIEQTKRRHTEFRPVQIGRRIRRNDPAKLQVFMQALRNLHEADESHRKECEVAVQEARKHIWQPNTSKIENIPPMFQIPRLVHPVTGEALLDMKDSRHGQPMYEGTWVEEFVKPRIDPSERANLSKLYGTRYRIASALALEQEIISKCFAFESEEAPGEQP